MAEVVRVPGSQDSPAPPLTSWVTVEGRILRVSLPAPRFPAGIIVTPPGCRTAEGRQGRWPSPGSGQQRLPLEHGDTVPTLGTMGPSRGKWRWALHAPGPSRGLEKPGIFTSPTGRRGNWGTKRLDDFPKVTQLRRGEWRFQPKPRGAGALSGGCSRPHPAPPAQRSREAGSAGVTRPARRGPRSVNAAGLGPRR